MSSAMRHVAAGLGASTLMAVLSVSLSTDAHATTLTSMNNGERATSLGCGYDGYVGGSATYNHCARGSVVIEVDHLFWQHNYACMPPGVHAIPQGNISWAIIGAEADGNTCTWPYPISIVGP